MSQRTLSASPSMPVLFARAGAAMLPGASRLPFVGGGGGEIPDLTLVLRDVAVEADRLASYNRVCGFDTPGAASTLPATYPHMLAFPLHLALMTDASFPFPAIGLVHIVNRIVHHRPIRVDERLDLRVWATPVEPHPRGRQFSIMTEARAGEELVWEEVSTNLRRSRAPGAGSERAASTSTSTSIDVPSAADLPSVEDWQLRGDLGRRYGSVSGDLNPIHVHPLTARLFGFPSAIAHGMWTKARCLAALQPRLPDAFTVDVAFRKPILLPATVTFAAADGPSPRFGVRGAGAGGKATAHLDGTVIPDAAA
jgi:acyl dehydratase